MLTGILYITWLLLSSVSLFAVSFWHGFYLLDIAAVELLSIGTISPTALIFLLADFPFSILRLGEIFIEFACFYADSLFCASLYDTDAQSTLIDFSELLLYACFFIVNLVLFRSYSLWRISFMFLPLMAFCLFLCVVFGVFSFGLSESLSGLLSFVADDLTFFEESADRFVLLSKSFFSYFVAFFAATGFFLSFVSFARGYSRYIRWYFWCGLFLLVIFWDLSFLCTVLCMCVREVLVFNSGLQGEYLKMF